MSTVFLESYSCDDMDNDDARPYGEYVEHMARAKAERFNPIGKITSDTGIVTECCNAFRRITTQHKNSLHFYTINF
jgi:hypothetical protein